MADAEATVGQINRQHLHNIQAYFVAAVNYGCKFFTALTRGLPVKNRLHFAR
jgi:hypothetical protein